MLFAKFDWLTLDNFFRASKMYKSETKAENSSFVNLVKYLTKIEP